MYVCMSVVSDIDAHVCRVRWSARDAKEGRRVVYEMKWGLEWNRQSLLYILIYTFEYSV